MQEQKLWMKFIVVFLYRGVSAVLPLALAWLSQNPSYLLLSPIIAAGWQTLEKYLVEKNLLIGARDGGQPVVWH